MRSRTRPAVAVGPARQAPRAPTATTSRRSSSTRRRSASVLGLPGYARLPQGQADHDDDLRLLGRPARHRFDGTRFTLQEIFLSTLTNFLYDDGRAPDGEPSWWGLQKKQAVAQLVATASSCWRWSRTPTTARSSLPPPQGGAVQHQRRARSRSARSPTRSPSSRSRVREAADAAMRAIAERRGLGRFMKLTETQGAYVRPSARRLPDGRDRRTSASSTTAARCSATRACTASARRSSRRRWASTRR